MRRVDLQAGADAKLQDATILMKQARYSNAYYLAGYAIELGLKACIARQIVSDTIPEREFLNGVFNHDLPKLVGLAGLSKELKDKQKQDAGFAANWAICANWRPDVRYKSVTAMEAQLLVHAIGNSGDGVLPWIRKFW